jgi:transcriptional regulator with XRE-family HTH domain
MGSRSRTTDAARDRGRDLTSTVLRELRDGRIDRNVSGARVAEALGCSPAQYSRLERGITGGLTIEQAAVALAAVGLELSVRVFPGGRPIRDVAHTALIDRLRVTCHASIRVLTEVPLPGAADQRAWDVVLAAPTWRHPVEVETRPRDRQALERRIALKARDGGFEAVSLLLLDSRHNREFVRVHADLLAARFPVPASVAMAALRAGVDPGPGAIILL